MIVKRQKLYLGLQRIRKLWSIIHDRLCSERHMKEKEYCQRFKDQRVYIYLYIRVFIHSSQHRIIYLCAFISNSTTDT